MLGNLQLIVSSLNFLFLVDFAYSALGGYTITDEHGFYSSLIYEGCQITMECNKANFYFPDKTPFPSSWIRKDKNLEPTMATFKITSSTQLGEYTCQYKDRKEFHMSLTYFIKFFDNGSKNDSKLSKRWCAVTEESQRNNSCGQLSRDICFKVHAEQDKKSQDYTKELFCMGWNVVDNRCESLARHFSDSATYFKLPYAETTKDELCTSEESEFTPDFFPPSSNWGPTPLTNYQCDDSKPRSNYLLIHSNFEIHITSQMVYMCHMCAPNRTFNVLVVGWNTVLHNNTFQCPKNKKQFYTFYVNTSQYASKINAKVNFVIKSELHGKRGGMMFTQGYAVTIAARTSIAETGHCQSNSLPSLLNCSLLQPISNYSEFQPSFQWFIDGHAATDKIQINASWLEIEVTEPGLYECKSHVKYKKSPIYSHPDGFDDTFNSSILLSPNGRTCLYTTAATTSDKELYVHMIIVISAIIFAIAVAHLAYFLVSWHRKKQKINFLLGRDSATTEESVESIFKPTKQKKEKKALNKN